MRLTDFLPEVVEAWAVHEAFRRLGFRPEDIFLTIIGGKEPRTLVGLRLMSGKNFDLEMGFAWPDAAPAQWVKLCEAVNRGEITDTDGREVFEASRVGGRIDALVDKLCAKGIRPPRMPRKWD